MTLQSILGFIAKRWTFVVLLLAVTVYERMQLNSPTHPDRASGHVFPVTAPRSRRMPKHTLYLTSAERSLYHGSFIVIVVSTLGTIGQAIIQKRNRASAENSL